MAAATTILAGTAIAGGVAKAASGAKQKRDAKRAARNFRRQELKNVQRNRRISTRGADLAREEMQRGTATSVDALRSGGVRGVVGGTQGVQEANIAGARRIGAGLDEQQVQLDRDIAFDDANIRSMQENRDTQELNAIQQQVNAGNEQMWSGFGDIASGVGGFASAGGFGGGKTAGAGLTPSKPLPSQSSLNSTFAVNNPVFTGSPINPLTGLPY